MENNPLKPKKATPKECRDFSASTKDLPAYAQLSPEECEMMEEEISGEPMNHVSTSEGIAAMQRRIEVLKKLKAKTLAAMDNCSDSLMEALMKDGKNLDRDIADARQRLDYYEQQLKSQN